MSMRLGTLLDRDRGVAVRVPVRAGFWARSGGATGREAGQGDGVGSASAGNSWRPCLSGSGSR
jgi:hypothetical protein